MLLIISLLIVILVVIIVFIDGLMFICGITFNYVLILNLYCHDACYRLLKLSFYEFNGLTLFKIVKRVINYVIQ